MSLFISLAICFIPLLLAIILCIVFIKDFKVIFALSSVFFGFIAIVLIIVVRTIVSDVSSIFSFSLEGLIGIVISTIFFAFVEESVKMLLIPLFPKKIATLKNFMFACLIFGCTVGCVETLMYLVTGFSGTITRLFTAVVIHTLCALLSGYYVWALKNKVRYIGPFLMSILLHSLYNYFIAQVSPLRWFAVVILLFALLRCRVNYVTLKEKTESLGLPS